MQANTVLQTYLDRLSRAVLDDDWETYADGVSLPFQMITERAAIDVTSLDDLREGFEAFVDMLRSQRVTDYIRTVRSAAQVGNDALYGSYTTETLSHGKRIAPPFRSRIFLRREDGVWRATSIANTLTNWRWPVLMPTVNVAD